MIQLQRDKDEFCVLVCIDLGGLDRRDKNPMMSFFYKFNFKPSGLNW